MFDLSRNYLKEITYKKESLINVKEIKLKVGEFWIKKLK